ncbi:MAG: hypothetical protein RL637_771 [Pseudomonadota bacterium]|jgi:predicted ATP-grasp superfamily ATP-dependent carboligase
MKILIFEYLSGGGFAAQALPSSLAQEGLLMLQSLLADFAELAEHQLTVLLDHRCSIKINSIIETIIIEQSDDLELLFIKQLNKVDAVWLIIPETEQLLYRFTQYAEQANCQLFSSSSMAIHQTGDKWICFQKLIESHIPTIPSQLFNEIQNSLFFPCVIKAREGVGCQDNYVLTHLSEYTKIAPLIINKNNYLIQPYIQGIPLSLSALFYRGQAQLICINQQELTIHDCQFHLKGCLVNLSINPQPFDSLLSKIAIAFPDLLGYIGIDLLQIEQQLIVVEINPRLTSSYIGIRQALGINIAKIVIDLIQLPINLSPSCYQTIAINFTEF